ncbi:MAG: hypothetical protein ACK5NA_06845 [Enterococcus sp.]
MINAIRADFYRLLHVKAFYITQIALITIVLLTIFTKTLGSSGVMTDQLNQLQSGTRDLSWDSYQTVIAISTMAAFLVYFCLPLFVMILGHDLTRKTYKNQIAIGISRWHFFVSKYLIFLLVSALQFVFYYGFTFLTAGIRYGFGIPPEHFWGDIFRTIGLQFLAFQAIFAIALLLLSLTFSNVAAVIVVIVSSIIIEIISAIFSKVEWIKYFDFQTNINITWLKDMPDQYWLKATTTALFFTLILVFLAYQAIQKHDL